MSVACYTLSSYTLKKEFHMSNVINVKNVLKRSIYIEEIMKLNYIKILIFTSISNCLCSEHVFNSCENSFLHIHIAITFFIISYDVSSMATLT